MANRLQFVTATEFKKRQEKGMKKKVGVRKGFALGEVKRIDEGEDGLVLRLTISTGTLDRDGDTIAVDGWELKDYNANPVVLWAHSHNDPPVAKSLKVWVEREQLKSDARFTPHDLNPFGHMIGRLYEAGYMRATSVGFLPLEWDEAEERESDHSFFMPIDFKRQALLEYSAVPVPSNPEALADAKAKGVVDLAPMVQWAERVLDEAGEGDKGLWVPRQTVEGIHRLLSREKTVVLPAQAPDEAPKNGDSAQPRAQGPQDEEPFGEGKEPGKGPNDDSSGSGEVISEQVDEKTSASEKDDHLRSWTVVLEPSGQGRVELNGEPIEGVREVEILGAVGKAPSIRLDVLPKHLSVQGKSEHVATHKAGRALSKANEERLRRAQELIGQVLESVAEGEEDHKSVFASKKGGPDHADEDEVILELAPEELKSEPNDEHDVDLNEVAQLIQRSVKENLNRLRGRVD